jgi:mono/diheme cytochrome c family protein
MERGGSGDALMNIAYRSSFKGGMAPTLLDATNACVTGWMGGEALTASSEEFVALRTFFESVSDPAVTTPNTMMPEVLADEAAYETAYAGGDATRGAASYARYCARCHEGALSVAGVSSFPRSILASRTAGRIAQKVRTAGPPPSGTADPTDTTGGPMPFFEPDELPSDELRDIIAYVRSTS